MGVPARKHIGPTTLPDSYIRPTATSSPYVYPASIYGILFGLLKKNPLTSILELLNDCIKLLSPPPISTASKGTPAWAAAYPSA
jgi:hypothetical protein